MSFSYCVYFISKFDVINKHQGTVSSVFPAEAWDAKTSLFSCL